MASKSASLFVDLRTLFYEMRVHLFSSRPRTLKIDCTRAEDLFLCLRQIAEAYSHVNVHEVVAYDATPGGIPRPAFKRLAEREPRFQLRTFDTKQKQEIPVRVALDAQQRLLKWAGTHFYLIGMNDSLEQLVLDLREGDAYVAVCGVTRGVRNDHRRLVDAASEFLSVGRELQKCFDFSIDNGLTWVPMTS